jgi:hypothetical protein
MRSLAPPVGKALLGIPVGGVARPGNYFSICSTGLISHQWFPAFAS